jgi:hypothetical protein
MIRDSLPMLDGQNADSRKKMRIAHRRCSPLGSTMQNAR